MPSTNIFAFLTRASVAVAHEFAYCTSRCTSRKGIVNAQPTDTENRKNKKQCQHEKSQKLNKISPRAARFLLSQKFWWDHEKSIHYESLPTDSRRSDKETTSRRVDMKAASVRSSKVHDNERLANSDLPEGTRLTSRPRVGASAGLNFVDT